MDNDFDEGYNDGMRDAKFDNFWEGVAEAAKDVVLFLPRLVGSALGFGITAGELKSPPSKGKRSDIGFD